MRTRISLGVLAVSLMFLVGCERNGESFTLTVHNDVANCAGVDGKYNLAYKYEYLADDGETIQSDGTAALGTTATEEINDDAADEDDDGYIDHVVVSVNQSCDVNTPYWHEVTLDNQIPNGGTVAFTEDQLHNVTYEISGPTSPGTTATSAVQQLFGAKPAAKGKANKSK